MSALRSLGRQLKRNAEPECSPIGLEFGADGLHMVQLGWASHGKPVVRAQVMVPYAVRRQDTLNSPAAVKKLIKQALAKAPFKGRRVVTALAAEDTRLLSVTYQTRAGEDDSAAIGKLMAERIDDDLAQFVIDYIPVRTEARDGERLALVVISERNKVIAHLELLRKAGVEVEALEIAPVAIRRAVSTLIAGHGPSKDVLVINVGDTATHLVVVSGRRLLFEQQIDLGVSQLTEALTDALDLTPELALELIAKHGLRPAGDAAARENQLQETGHFSPVSEILGPRFRGLVNEIRRALQFAATETRGGQMAEAFLLGPIAGWPGATDLLSELTGLDVRIPPCLSKVAGVANETAAGSTGAMIATGLALRGAPDDA